MTTSKLTPPRFHHVHLRSADPVKAVNFYARQFNTVTSGVWGGFPAALSANDVMILFEQDDNILSEPQSALWHFGWHVTDSKATTNEFIARREVQSLPLYTGVGDGHVPLSSDTWFMTGDKIGVTLAQIDALKASGTPPSGGPGFAYFQGPDDALYEIAGDYPQERFNHIHMWHEDPLCAQIWYQKHFLVPARDKFGDVKVPESQCKVPRTNDRTFPALNSEGMYRSPPGGVTVGDVDLLWYPNQGDTPLASSLGQLMDHIAFSVPNLDAWIDKLRHYDVTFLSEEYLLANTRAVMIEGPSLEAIEIIEIT
ncbi:hypothetical protein OAA86_01125 [Rhodospirillales bacterium]|nr:hypothetical protein [Rhodospirillales bacterium]